MATQRLTWTTWMTAGALALGGCAGGETPERGSNYEDGVYRYVLDYDRETGTQILGGSHEVVRLDIDGKDEAIDAPNAPDNLHPQLGLPDYQKFEPELTEGETDWDVFPSNWWPQSKNGIADRWASESFETDYEATDDVDGLSPIEKYDLLVHGPDARETVEAVEHWDATELNKPRDERGDKHSHDSVTVIGPATAWELENHGIYQSRAHPDSWWGHCNGWASYATTEEGGAPARDIRVKFEAGRVVECAEESPSEECVLFRMGDIEALMTELYFSDQATFAGRRCNTNPEELELDEYGRPLEAACRDLNPGSFHIGVVGMLSRGAQSVVTEQEALPAFIIDHAADWEVWNFPLVEFEINEAEEVSMQEAAELVGAEEYEFNEDARNFARVRLTYTMVSDAVPPRELRKPAPERQIPAEEVELNYVLELDANDNILGGEWIDLPSAEIFFGDEGKSKTVHPDFYWMGVQSAGRFEDADDQGGSSDNPFLSYSTVRALLDCANDPATCNP